MIILEPLTIRIIDCKTRAALLALLATNDAREALIDPWEQDTWQEWE